MPNYQLLVNADDFGRHVLIDQAVKRLSLIHIYKGRFPKVGFKPLIPSH